MSDAFRKDTHTKLGEKMRMSPLPPSPVILQYRTVNAFTVHFPFHTRSPFPQSIPASTNTTPEPQSSKSTATKIKESVTGTGDKIAREAQPDHTKTNTQSTMDKFGRSKDNNVHGSTGGSVVDKTKNALGLGHHTTNTHTTHTHGSGL
jgi:hypothetical protein